MVGGGLRFFVGVEFEVLEVGAVIRVVLGGLFLKIGIFEVNLFFLFVYFFGGFIIIVEVRLKLNFLIGVRGIF